MKLKPFFLCLLLSLPFSLGSAKEPDPRVVAESAKANDFFDRVFDEKVARYPEWQTYLGIKENYGEWSDESEAMLQKELEHTKRNLQWLETNIDYGLLDAQTKVSYRMAVEAAKDEIRNFMYRHYNYPVNQMFGRHTGVPSFLINMHLVADREDAEAYIERLRGVEKVFDQLIEGLVLREEKGIVPPQFVFPRAIESCANVISGAPFDASGKDSALFEDFKTKLRKLELKEADQASLELKAQRALREVVQPAYRELIAFLKEQEARATKDDGVWKFKDGDAFYAEALRLTTTTDMTAEVIHQVGLREVERIHGEMRGIMRQVGFRGDLKAFFEFMRTDQQFYFPNTDAGKEAYMEQAVAVIDDMRERLDALFFTKPQAEMIVKRVEAFREKSAGTAFYQRPAPDGSRPGIYYANLYDTANMPKYKLEALAYHEGIPGHHMQLAIAQELKGLPKFRKYGSYTAYIEGWGLYCELIPKEMGLYRDPYSDFGRLSMELWRACRLVVDTGIHAKRWTREEGIAFYQENTPDTERDCIRMVERHIVMPSQATAYKVGMLKLLELREKARREMNGSFDIRKFHDVVLTNGAVPLTILEELVEDYIETH